MGKAKTAKPQQMTGKFKVGDKVTIKGISNVMSSTEKEVVGTTSTITKVGKYYYDCANNYQFYEEQLEIANPKINGHLWLIVDKDSGKALAGFGTRKYARFYKNFYPDNTKIVKYVF